MGKGGDGVGVSDTSTDTSKDTGVGTCTTRCSGIISFVSQGDVYMCCHKEGFVHPQWYDSSLG